MAEKPGKAASVRVEVLFREVDALHDLQGRRLVGSAAEPRVAIDNDLRDLLLVDYYRMPQFVDEMGDEVDGQRDDVPGMYGAVRVAGSEPFWRTFSRERTLPIDRKYVYVFSGDSPAGGNLRLEHELYFDKGQIRGHSSVRLEVVRTIDGRTVRPAYFALLSPMQIPSSRLQDVMQDGSVAVRSSRLGDAFWTDGFTGHDPSTAKTFHELFRGGRKPDALGLVLYLVDPFKEALRRLELLQKNLDGWLEKQGSMASDDRYVLARRMDLFANAYGLQATVNPALPAYLLDAEKELFKLRLAAEDGCETLLRWIGRAQQHDRIESVDVCYRNRLGIEYHAKEGQPYPTSACSPFSEAVRDCLEAGGDAREVAKNVTHAVQSRLGETTAGVAWMNEVFDDFVEKRFPVATAGAELLFDGRRKGVGAEAELWAPLFRCWAPVWARRYGREATRNLQGWLKATHDVDVATMTAAHSKREWRALKKGRKDPELLWIDATATRLGRLGDTAAVHVVAGFQLFNLAYSVGALRGEEDAWHGLGLMGAIGDACADAARLHEKVERSRVTFKYAGASKRLEVAPFIAVLASTIDHVLVPRDRLNAKNDSGRIVHATRTLGTAISVASASRNAHVGTTGVGPLVAGLMLESTGSYEIADVAAAEVLLKHCAWGNGGDGFDRAFDRSHGSFFGYPGELADLAADLDAQARVLDEIINDFKPELDLEKEYETRMLVLRTGTGADQRKNPLSPASRWTIDLSIDRGDGRPPDQWSFRAGAAVTDSDASMNEPILVKAFTKPPDLEPHARARITVVGTVRVDPVGAGGQVIERRVEGAFDLGWVGR